MHTLGFIKEHAAVFKSFTTDRLKQLIDGSRITSFETKEANMHRGAPRFVNSNPVPSSPDKPRRTWKQRIVHNFREFVAMFLYLWLLFALFTFHKAIVLSEHRIPFKPFGLAFVNAFVLAKIMLVAEELNLATRWRNRAPIFPILHKSFLFAVILVAFTFTEHILLGLWRGRSFAESMPEIGSGSPSEIIVASLIIAIALIPFFAFREVGRVLGKGVLETLLLKSPRKNDLTSSLRG